MPSNNDPVGTDLLLLPRLDQASSRDSSNDLQTRPTGRGDDLVTVAGECNLKQSLLLRLLTPTGTLARLGHPEYGSDLELLRGRPGNEATQTRARLSVIRALKQEPRVLTINRVIVLVKRDCLEIDAEVRVVQGVVEIDLTVPLRGGPTAPRPGARQEFV